MTVAIYKVVTGWMMGLRGDPLCSVCSELGSSKPRRHGYGDGPGHLGDAVNNCNKIRIESMGRG